MLVKFFKRGVGSASGATDYLLGENRDRENATLLRGDPENINELSETVDYSRRYTSGVLSFEESNIPENVKKELMDSFERALFPGLTSQNFSVLWVEHLDKGRLELNFVIPNVELQTGKRLQPYYDRVDRRRVNAWKDMMNIEHGFSDPNEPSRKETLVTPKDLPKATAKVAEYIDNQIRIRVGKGLIKNRDDVVKALESAGLTVARKTKQSLSIANPEGGRNIRLKGAFYEQDFRIDRAAREAGKAAQQHYKDSSKQRYQDAKQLFKKEHERKLEYHRERFIEPAEESKKHALAADVIRTHAKPVLDNAALGGDSLSGTPSHTASRQGRQQLLSLHGLSSDERQPRPASNLVQDTIKTETENDRVRNPIIERIRTATASLGNFTDKLRAQIQRITDSIIRSSGVDRETEINTAIEAVSRRREPLQHMQKQQDNSLHQPRP